MGTPEMGRYLRQIVDNSFEEGQFESAVAMLDQLRAPVHRPSIIHILHLVFIALHPVHDSQLNDEDRYDPATLLAQSPRKMIKQTKASIILSSAAVLAARRLLLAFLATNGAHAIGPALPFYPETKNEVPMEFEFGESPIFEQAAAIKTSTRSVWEILKSGYTSRAAQHFGLGSPKGKRRESTRVRFTAEPSFSDVRQDIQVVGDDSWFVLEWLVTLFEKDAEETEAQGQPRYSPLLLKQLPPPPMGSTTRWDASEPAKIVFYAFQQPDLRIQKVGLRLLLLLIDLTQTSLLNLPVLASTVLAQMTSSSSASNSPSPRTRSRKTHTPSPSPAPSTALAFASSFDTLFAHLPSSPAALSFKLALCRKIIEDAASLASADADDDGTRPGGVGGWGGGGNGARGAPGMGQSAMKRPRAVPRPVARQRTMTESTDASNSGAGVPSSPTMSKTASSSSSIAPPPPLSASSTLASIAPSTSTSTTATSASLPVRPKTFVARLPSWTDVVRLARVSVESAAPGPGGAGEQPSANANPNSINGNGKKRAGRTNAHARNPNLTNLTITNPSRPWTAPSVLARVKFEMMLAYAVVQVMRREVSSTSPPSGAPTSNGAPDPSPTLDDPPDPAFLQSHTDGSYAALLDDVFALQGSNEDEERLGYVLVLRAVVGIGVGVE